MEIKFYDCSDSIELKYAVICAHYKNQWIFVRHKDRLTWEVPGGHIEKDELPDAAASRELIEETGAVMFSIEAICNYSVERSGSIGFGRLYFAEVIELGKLPEFEIAEITLRDELPEDLTYKDIQPYLYKKVMEYLNKY